MNAAGWFVVGALIGAAVGTLVIGLLAGARRGDDLAELHRVQRSHEALAKALNTGVLRAVKPPEDAA